jgi:hypothetical protein
MSTDAKPKIVFLVMSAVEDAATVDQLARALAPHQVLVHHDFSQNPAFRLSAPNVVFVPDPKATGWANFGFVDGIFHSLRHALDHLDFDYLQLLSPTCLPIKPIDRFEAHVAGDEDAHYTAMALLADRDVLMSVGYRAFTPDRTLRHRVVGWLTRRYFGITRHGDGVSGRRDVGGIWLRTGYATGRRGRMTVLARIAYAAVSALSHPAIGRHRFTATSGAHFGSVWFGARRAVVASMLEAWSGPGGRDCFRRLHKAEEFVIPTLLRRTGARAGALNHYVHTFDGARSGRIGEADLPTLRVSPAFFARKFSDDAAAPVRLRVLRELARVKVDVRARPSPRRADEVPGRPAAAQGGAAVAPGPPPGVDGGFAY